MGTPSSDQFGGDGVPEGCKIVDKFAEQWCVQVTVTSCEGRVTPLGLAAFDRCTGEIVHVCLHAAPEVRPVPFAADAIVGTTDVSAMCAVFTKLNVQMPYRIIDLTAETRNAANGWFAATNLHQLMTGLGAQPVDAGQMAYAESLARAQPVAGSPDAKFAQQIAGAAAVALHHLWAAAVSGRHLEHALARGRYSLAAAAVEAHGLPLNPALAALLSASQGSAATRFAAARAQLPSRAHGALAAGRTFAPTLCPTGRSHPQVVPYGTVTGRNAPTPDHLFNRPTWLRGLLLAPPRRRLALLDWRHEELGIAASLAGDDRLWRLCAQRGDAYGVLARALGLLDGDTMDAGTARQCAKRAVLVALNGGGAQTIAKAIGGSAELVETVLKRLDNLLAPIRKWQRRVLDAAALDGVLTSAFGWQMRFRQCPRGRVRSELSAMNFPIQANGADMMRLATIIAVERGVHVCAIVHDAFVVEAADDKIDDAVVLMHTAMDRACAAVLGKQRVLPVQTKAFTCGVELLDADALTIFQAVFPERGLDKGVTP